MKDVDAVFVSVMMPPMGANKGPVENNIETQGVGCQTQRSEKQMSYLIFIPPFVLVSLPTLGQAVHYAPPSASTATVSRIPFDRAQSTSDTLFPINKRNSVSISCHS